MKTQATKPQTKTTTATTTTTRNQNNTRSNMARTTQKNTAKAAKGPVVAAKLSYNGVALPTDVAERRKMRNKLSAKAHREKKKDALAGAKQEVVACDRELAHLKSELTEVSLICVYIIVILDMQ